MLQFLHIKMRNAITGYYFHNWAITILGLNNGKEIAKISVDETGIFKNLFTVIKGLYMFFDGKEYSQIFLKNNYKLKIKMDAQQFDELIV